MIDIIPYDTALPEWNDLPEKLRSELVKLAEDECCRCCADAFGAELAFSFYHKLREQLPQRTFPLFKRTAPFRAEQTR